MESIGSEAYNGVNLFENTAPMTARESATPKKGAVDLGDPNDGGVDISSLVGGATQLWKEMKKNANVSVNIRQCGNNVDKMIRKFIKKTKKEKIVEQVRERRYYKKPSVAKKEKRLKAQRLRMQEERKRRRAQERRNRNNK